MKRQVDWLVNGLLTGPIFLRALNQLTQLEIFSARDKDWPVNKPKPPKFLKFLDVNRIGSDLHPQMGPVINPARNPLNRFGAKSV